MELIAGNYSSSDSESEGFTEIVSIKTKEVAKQSDLPPLPDSITEKYHILPEGSRKAMGLIDKFWTTFIYLEWRPSSVERNLLTNMVMKFNKVCRDSKLPITKNLHFQPLHISPLGSPLSLHVSLSQNITFQDEIERDALFDTISHNISSSGNNKPFLLKFEPKYQLLASSKTNVVFLALQLSSEVKNNYIRNISKVITKSLKETLPKLSDKELQNFCIDPNFAHISIAQCPSVPKTVIEYLPLLQADLPMSVDSNTLGIPVSSIKFDKNRQVLNIHFHA